VNKLFNSSPCPICGFKKQQYLFENHGYSVVMCTECNLILSIPSILSSGTNYFSIGSNKFDAKVVLPEGITESDASRKYLQMLTKLSTDSRNILLIAEPRHCFATMAKDFGFNVLQHISISEFEKGFISLQLVDAVIMLYQLEKSSMIEKVLDNIYSILKSDGMLFLVTLSLDSQSARILGQSWVGWRPENKYYFDNTNIKSLLWKSGFDEVQLDKDQRGYTLAHINDRIANFPKSWITKSVKLAYGILPNFLHTMRFSLPTSGIILSARKAERHKQPVLSIIVPVYNESSTFPDLMSQLAAKNINGVRKEIIIVESNSDDNSRELVMKYDGRPEFKIVLQDRAKGKGNAVREGIENAQGDIVIIQDADLEYDLNDYEALLDPILSYKKPFVLGSRHSGNWKIRHFNDQQHFASFFNFGHVLFAGLLNLLYGQRMKDPFTMFKVFRRDCLYNLKFECNRFDFDFELVIKLIRKGYKPFEIPVNYNSRSFVEGKKVTIFRDPLTWIRALIKYRFAKITKE